MGIYRLKIKKTTYCFQDVTADDADEAKEDYLATASIEPYVVWEGGKDVWKTTIVSVEEL